VFNVTGGELVIILLVALIVLGPDKLPDAIRKVGRVYGELRRMSAGFQSELRDALDEPLREVRDTVDTVKSGFTLGDDGEPMPTATPSEGPRLPPDDGAATAAAPEPEPDAGETSDAPGADAAATAPANGTAPANASNGTPAVPPVVMPAPPVADEPVAPAETD
jgi:sec-independent protein translocase protein TatB